MQYLPIYADLKDSTVLLVGGGTIATRKARLLIGAGARLTVIAPAISEELKAMLDGHGGHWQQECYRQKQPETLKDIRLVVAATPDQAVNETVSDDARKAGLLVNVVDSPHLCTFIFPSIVERGPLNIAISSSGQSPVLARLLRRKIEAWVPATYAQLASFAGAYRTLVKQSIPEDTPRRRFWENAIEGTIGELVMAGRETEAEQLLRQQLQDHSVDLTGEVYLIGAGPGDPELMTFKAVRLLQKADVVLHDRLVAPDIIDMARRDAERIYVGKARANHAVPQSDINQLMVDLAQQGKCVARLKGGDPFIFGRGGEEIELLAQHHIPFQVVPGITAASGSACYAGIPLTHRDHAQSVRFVAGHLTGNRVEHDWTQFQSETETLVFYMGLVGLPSITEQLQAHGRSADTPVALIERGTSSEQRVLIGTLATICNIVEQKQPKAPTLIIVGNVVRLHDTLSWFGQQR